MMRFFYRTIEPAQSRIDCAASAGVVAVIVLVSAPAAAADTSSPLNAAAAVPAMTYQSPLTDFQAFAPDEPMASWKKANDRVGELGGWRTYLKNATKKRMSEDSRSRGEAKNPMKHNDKSK